MEGALPAKLRGSGAGALSGSKILRHSYQDTVTTGIEGLNAYIHGDVQYEVSIVYIKWENNWYNIT